MNGDDVITELSYKIERLGKLYISFLSKSKTLGERITELETEVKRLKEENTNLKNELKTTKLANAISGGEESYDARLKINQLVREIDKCITLLQG